MSWIRGTVQTVHLSVLVLVCTLTLYNVVSHEPGLGDDQEQKNHALTIVESDEADQNDSSIVVVELDEEIEIENKEPFIPTKEWQNIKPGQAIPRGLHVRLNMETGEKEARLMQDDDGNVPASAPSPSDQQEKSRLHDQHTLDELKQAVKDLKSEKFQNVDMETLKKKHKFRSYEELKTDMESMNANIKTDAEIITELVQQFMALSSSSGDVMPVLEQLEYHLHQIDNALLFCDLGAMPTLLKCLNSTMEDVRSEAAVTLGSALQSNPKVQVSAIENGAMQVLLRTLAVDPSMRVRKRALYALSTMIRHFPFAQKRFLELGGLSVLTKLFEDKAIEKLQIRAVMLLADLVKEKNKNNEHLNPNDSTQQERIRQYGEVNLEEAMVETGWCSLIPSLLHVQEHGNREHVIVAMETMLPACQSTFVESVHELQTLRQEYLDLVTEELMENEDGDDGFFQSMVNTIDNVLAELAPSAAKDEL